MVNDWQLLERYAREGDESAFETLVRRYTPLVYGSALRRVGPSHADDVAQSVFIILARKAGRLRRGKARSLAGWLFRVTRFSASELIRKETRRQQREDKVEKEKLIFNRTVPLRDTWAKIEKAQQKK